MARYWEINGSKFRVEYDPATGKFVKKPAPDAKALAKLRGMQKKALAKLSAAAASADETEAKQDS
jgi:hypothetical protein